MPTTTASHADRDSLMHLYNLTETQRARRGHRFYPTRAELKRTPTISEITDPSQSPIHIHYFGGSFDAYVIAVDADARAYAYVRFAHAPEDAEWGVIDLRELEALQVGLVIIERDLHWEPCLLSEVVL